MTGLRVAHAVTIILMVWAAIYLPWLGSSGLRSEEGHRVLPAVEMLESGDYLVPRIGGQPYLRKPPLINWLVAASFHATGVRNEWTARLPSVLAVLATAMALVTLGRGLLGSVGSIAAALAWLSSLGMIEKGRMIEIEALYVSLFGLALVCWLKFWREGKWPWLTWTLPWSFLGLGMLAKGPALLFFFYAVVVAVLWQSGKLRELFHPAHLFGLFLMLAIFAAWALPYSRALSSSHAAQTWVAEVASRFSGAEGTLRDWLLNFPLGLAYFLPFGLFLPFIRSSKFSAGDRPLALGLALGSIIPFCVVLLLPGGMPRYILPTLMPGCLALGLAFKHDAFDWKRVSLRIASAVALVIASSAMIIFPLRSATVQKRHPGYELNAEPINAAIPAGEILYAIDPGYQPLLFYVRAPVRYVSRLDQLPADARYVLTHSKFETEMQNNSRWASRRPELLARMKSVRKQRTLFYALTP